MARKKKRLCPPVYVFRQFRGGPLDDDVRSVAQHECRLLVPYEPGLLEKTLDPVPEPEDTTRKTPMAEYELCEETGIFNHVANYSEYPMGYDKDGDREVPA